MPENDEEVLAIQPFKLEVRQIVRSIQKALVMSDDDALGEAMQALLEVSRQQDRIADVTTPEERDMLSYEYQTMGWSDAAIGELLGVGRETVRRYADRHYKEVIAIGGNVGTEMLRAQQMDRLLNLHRSLGTKINRGDIDAIKADAIVLQQLSRLAGLEIQKHAVGPLGPDGEIITQLVVRPKGSLPVPGDDDEEEEDDGTDS